MSAKFSFEVAKSYKFSEKLFTKASTGGVLQKKMVFLKISKI